MDILNHLDLRDPGGPRRPDRPPGSNAGAQINARRQNGETPLHLAVLQKELVERLVAKGAEVNAQDNLAKTPLMVAGAIGQSDVVRLLIANGAAMEAREAEGARHSCLPLSREMIIRRRRL